MSNPAAMRGRASCAVERLESRCLLSAPIVTSSSFDFERKPRPMVFQFDQDVSQSLTTSDNFLTNLTTDTVIPPSSTTRTYDAATNTAKFSVSPWLENGNYESILFGGGITNGSNEPMAQDPKLGFFWLWGDVNRDRRVSAGDYATIDANVGNMPTGARWSDGDINGDGAVTGDDYLAVDAYLGARLPAPPTEPNTLVATAAVGRGRIDLNWAPPAGARDGFRVWRSLDGGNTFTRVAEIVDPNATHWHQTGLADGTKYTYLVRAFTWADGSSHATNKAWAVTTPLSRRSCRCPR